MMSDDLKMNNYYIEEITFTRTACSILTIFCLENLIQLKKIMAKLSMID